MKRILLACAASAAFIMAAPAQEVPKLSDFLRSCFRDPNACRMKLKDYIVAADTQNIICRPSDMSLNEASGDMLRWLRTDDSHGKSLNDAALDDAFYLASTSLWPCKPPSEPAAPPATDQPAPAQPAPAP
jgi:hypothetical protein